MAEVNQDNQKTIVAFVVGLLIGGVLVWAFSGPNSDNKKTVETEQESNTEEVVSTLEENNNEEAVETPAPKLSVGEGAVSISNQPAGTSVAITNATYPVKEGWIGVRQYNDDKLGYILGVVRFSESQGLVPSDIILQTPTKAGSKYAVVIFSENGDFDFNLADDVQIDQIFTTFTAQ